jgi:hypothetical protein
VKLQLPCCANPENLNDCQVMKTPLLFFAAMAAAGGLSATAQDSRTWTNQKGQKLEGTFLKQDETTVWVRRGDGKEVAIPKKTLSKADLEHLADAAPAAPTAGRGRFANARIDPSAWKPRPGGFKLGTLVYPANLESEHFIIAGPPKVRPAMLTAYADAAERLWSDLATDFPALAEAFEGRKMPVILADDEKDAGIFSNWHGEHADASRTVSRTFNLETFTIASFRLDEKFAEENGLTTPGRLFRIDSKEAQPMRRTWPQRIHFLCDDLLLQWLIPVKTNGDYSISMLRLALSYHREELVCGKIESEVTFGGGADVEGFKNGRNWAGSTKKLLKAGAQPSIESFLETPGSKAEPRDLGFGLGLMHFIHADSARLDGFRTLLATAVEDKKSPDPEAFAASLGFDSPEGLNGAWRDFMLSDAFE